MITFIRTFISGELFTQRWMLFKSTGANKIYTPKRYKRAYSVLKLKELSTCLVCGMIFEKCYQILIVQFIIWLVWFGFFV